MVISEERLKEVIKAAWCDGRDAGNLEASEKVWDPNRCTRYVTDLCNLVNTENNPMTINETAALYGQEVKYEYQDCLDENVWHPFRAIVDHEFLTLMTKGEIRNVIRLR